ncbi:tRNA-dependent cyclodipeptide synthase [Streptomyces cylindrosporus]|uniref:Cyclodipeptide synthase n=1 Tax=Streptomyces cylindrosporus TaxID=2927583 RepID=A0ABS9YMW9_9ACTN|nr:tRNA-dependent cyclodipeptide synthase [Streptomyces cylindrosporus]MCI3278618.1 tRNA-dependent cyclodipeptide synthase [Streptomyces cylindrosporus]
MTTATVSEIQHVAPAGLFKVRPFTPHCEVIHTAADHAVIGVSPGNSYFSARRVLDLARWGLALFERVDLVYTDLHVAEMYEASGYTAEDARRKAVKNLRGVRAKVLGAVQATDPGGRRVRAHAMSDFRDNGAYREIHHDLRARLATDDEFRTTCEQLVDGFLATKDQRMGERQRQVCLEYVTAEAPLFLDTPAILGVPSSLNCYHQLLPMAELLYSPGAGLRASRNQGHAIVTPAGTEHADVR